MGSPDLIVGTDVDSGHDVAGGCFDQAHFAGRRKGAGYFYSEINVHGRLGLVGMMVEKDVVSVGAKARILSQKIPNFIESGTPCGGDLSDRDPAANGRKFPSRDGFDVDLGTHRNSQDSNSGKIVRQYLEIVDAAQRNRILHPSYNAKFRSTAC